MEDTLEEYITEGLSNAKISRLVHTWGAWDVKGKRRTLKLLEAKPFMKFREGIRTTPKGFTK